MKSLLVLTLIVSVLCQHSLSDKCYVQYWKRYTDRLFGYQYYINRKGVPVSRDWIIHEFVPRTNNTKISLSYYYHYSLTCGEKKGNKYECTANCTSVWFKYVDEETNKRYRDNCGSHFHNKYRNVMENPCVIGGVDQWMFVKEQIGTVSKDTIEMNGKEPAIMDDFYKGDKCDIDYEILGLWPIVITIIVICCLVVLIMFIGIWIYAQKHRSQKRARLQSSLMNNEEGRENAV